MCVPSTQPEGRRGVGLVYVYSYTCLILHKSTVLIWCDAQKILHLEEQSDTFSISIVFNHIAKCNKGKSDQPWTVTEAHTFITSLSSFWVVYFCSLKRWVGSYYTPELLKPQYKFEIAQLNIRKCPEITVLPVFFYRAAVFKSINQVDEIFFYNAVVAQQFFCFETAIKGVKVRSFICFAEETKNKRKCVCRDLLSRIGVQRWSKPYTDF